MHRRHPDPVPAASPFPGCRRPADSPVRQDASLPRAPVRAAASAPLPVRARPGRSPCRRCRPSALRSAPRTPAGAPGRLLPQFHVPLSAYVVDCAVYVDGERLPGRFTHDRALAEVRRRGDGFVWIGLHEPTERADHRDRRRLRPARAGRRGRRARPPAAQAGALRRLALPGAQDRPLRASTTSRRRQRGRRDRRGHALHRPRLRHHRPARRPLAACPTCGAAWRPTPSSSRTGPSAVLHAIADRVVDDYLAVTDAHRGRHRRAGGARCSTPRSAPDAERIYTIKREVLELRRAVVPLGGPLRKLTEGYSALVPHDVRSYFRDVDDHLVTVAEQVAAFDELLTSLVDAALAQVTVGRTTTCARSPPGSRSCRCRRWWPASTA